MSVVTLPKRAPGRRSAARRAIDLAADTALCNWLENQWRTHGFAFGARGWGYVAEGVAIITKDQLDAFEDWLARVRKDGLLDPDVVSDDDSRAAEFIEEVDADDDDAIADDARSFARYKLDRYSPISQWDGLDTYIEVLVEKIDLKVLFRDVCERYGVVLVNGKGSSDVNLRRRMLQRFKIQHEAGRDCVLLCCFDHDPPGFRLSDVFKQNLIACANVRDVQWDPTPVRVERFGLNAAQIKSIRLPWINNLITASGKDLADPKHPDHRLPYVQDYIAAHGVRKVEANALAAHPVDAQALVRTAIEQYVPVAWLEAHAARLAPHRKAARKAFEHLIRTQGLGGSEA